MKYQNTWNNIDVHAMAFVCKGADIVCGYATLLIDNLKHFLSLTFSFPWSKIDLFLLMLFCKLDWFII